MLSIVMVYPSHPPALARGVGADTPSWPLAFLEAIWVIKRHDQLSRRWGVPVLVPNWERTPSGLPGAPFVH